MGQFRALGERGEGASPGDFDEGVEGGEGDDEGGEEDVCDCPGDFGDEDPWVLLVGG